MTTLTANSMHDRRAFVGALAVSPLAAVAGAQSPAAKGIRVTIDGEPLEPIYSASVNETPDLLAIDILTVSPDPVPSLLPGDFLATVRPGKTSDPATFGGKLPTKADDVQIIHDVAIDRLTANRCEIARGTATLVDAELHGSMLVHSTLTATAGELRFHVADDRLSKGGTILGPLPAIPALHIDDVGLWGLPGSTIKLDAGKKTSWASCTPLGHFAPGQYGTMLADAYGKGTATLDRDLVSWEAGDQLVLCDEKGNHVRATLTAVEGRTITYSGADDFTAKVIASGDKTAAPKVGNLTRPIRIVSADVKPGDTNHRAHTAILGDCLAAFRGVEFRDLGPRGFLGRYPVHWHMCNDTTGLVDSCSVWSQWSPSNRGLVDHHSRGVGYIDNICLLVKGHAVFCEDGHETRCEFIRNLVVNCIGPEEIATVDDAITKLTHSFWLRNGNKIEGNVAVGGDAIGHVILPILCKPCAKAFEGVRQQVVGCESFGGGKYGIWSMVPNVDIVGGAYVHAKEAGLTAWAPWGASSDGVTGRNLLLAFNGENPTDATYISQVFLTAVKGFRVSDSVLAGKKGIHVHYNVTSSFVDNLFNNEVLLTPTYWESVVDISNSPIVAVRAFDSAYTKRPHNPPAGRLTVTSSPHYSIGPQVKGVENEQGVVVYPDLEFIGMQYRGDIPGSVVGGKHPDGQAWRVAK